jgi:hypothetical protein
MFRHVRSLLASAALLVTVSAALQAQVNSDRLEIHGAINTAYGRSLEIPVLGVPSYGTTDYRNLMLQLRYQASDNEQVVVQLLNRRLGTSPLQAALPDVALHWGYYQRRGDWGSVKVGRAPMPRGIFNETRFVGTVLPLYRPSFEIYGEGRETVDGLVYSKSWRLAPKTALVTHAFAGSNEVRTQVVTATGNSIRAFRGDRLAGAQLWLQLPFYDTRLGAYGARYDNNSVAPAGDRGEYLFSAETKLPRLTARAEALRVYGMGPSQDRRSSTGQLVGQVLEWLDVVGEYSMTRNVVFQTAPLRNVDVTATRDIAAGITAKLPGGALVRLERHETRGYAFDRLVPFLTTTAGVTTVANPSRTSYWLASYAFSF